MSPSSSSSSQQQSFSLPLPLLEGLSHHSGTSDKIVQEEVFTRWRAALYIARGTESMWIQFKKRKEGPPPAKRRRRGGRKNQKEEQQQKKQQTVNSNSNSDSLPEKKVSQQQMGKTLTIVPYFHWLMQSLASASLQERQVACKILAQGCPLDDSSVWTCLEIVTQQIKEADPSRDSDSRSILVWTSICKHLVVNVLSSRMRLAFCVNRRMGLKWLCGTLWKLSQMALVKNNIGHRDERREHLVMRDCLAILDLVHYLVLEGHDDIVLQIHKFVWSTDIKSSIAPPDDDSLSPLACLIGTYHLWREFRSHTSMESYTVKLKQLCDPAALPKIDSSRTTTGNEKHTEYNRLIDTFANSNTESATEASNPSGAGNRNPTESGTSTLDRGGNRHTFSHGVFVSK